MPSSCINLANSWCSAFQGIYGRGGKENNNIKINTSALTRTFMWFWESYKSCTQRCCSYFVELRWAFLFIYFLFIFYSLFILYSFFILSLFFIFYFSLHLHTKRNQLLGIFHLAKTELDEALQNFNQVLKNAATNLVALLGKARVLFAQKQYPQSLRLYQQVLQLNPNAQPDPRIGIGLCFWAMNEKEKAKMCWERSLEVVSLFQFSRLLVINLFSEFEKLGILLASWAWSYKQK